MGHLPEDAGGTWPPGRDSEWAGTRLRGGGGGGKEVCF